LTIEHRLPRALHGGRVLAAGTPAEVIGAPVVVPLRAV